MTLHQRLVFSVALLRLEAIDPDLARLTRLVIEEADAREREANSLIARNKRLLREQGSDLHFTGASA